MTDLDPAALAVVAEQLGITEAEAAQRLGAAPSRTVTVGDHVDGFLKKLTQDTRRTYRTSLLRFADGIGPVCDQACEPCLDPETGYTCRCDCAKCTASALTLPAIRAQVVDPAIYNKSAIEGVATVARRLAIRRGVHENRKRAAKGKPKKVADGIGAQETAISAMRALFQNVPDLIDGYDGLDVAKPPRAGRERRPLLDFELVELSQVTATGGDDPELDDLLVDYGLQTGARRSGAYELTVAQIRAETQLIKVKDKYDREQDAPVSAELIDRLLDHAIGRGGPTRDPNSRSYEPDSPVFHHRDRSGEFRPITSRRFDTVHERWQRDMSWAAEEQVGYHHIRHTRSHVLKTSYGPQYAKRYVRHSKGDVTDTYGACTTAELARALADLFEYEHPLVHGITDRRNETMRRFGLD